MFKSIFALAATSLPLAYGFSDQLNDAAAVQCQAVTTTSGSVFNIEGIEKEGSDYKKSVPLADGSGNEDLIWNYCTYATGGPVDKTTTYAYTVQADGTTKTAIATKAIAALSAKNIKDADKKVIGVLLTQNSSSVCTDDGTTKVNWSMETSLMCKEDVKDAPTIKSVTADGCVYKVVMEHKDGCPDLNLDLEYYS
jgi:hypothetical protein